MPVPQKFNVLVERARCPFLKIVQDVSGNKYYFGIRRVEQLRHTIVVFR